MNGGTTEYILNQCRRRRGNAHQCRVDNAIWKHEALSDLIMLRMGHDTVPNRGAAVVSGRYVRLCGCYRNLFQLADCEPPFTIEIGAKVRVWFGASDRSGVVVEMKDRVFRVEFHKVVR